MRCWSDLIQSSLAWFWSSKCVFCNCTKAGIWLSCVHVNTLTDCCWPGAPEWTGELEYHEQASSCVLNIQTQRVVRRCIFTALIGFANMKRFPSPNMCFQRRERLLLMLRTNRHKLPHWPNGSGSPEKQPNLSKISAKLTLKKSGFVTLCHCLWWSWKVINTNETFYLKRSTISYNFGLNKLFFTKFLTTKLKCKSN